MRMALLKIKAEQYDSSRNRSWIASSSVQRSVRSFRIWFARSDEVGD